MRGEVPGSPQTAVRPKENERVVGSVSISIAPFKDKVVGLGMGKLAVLESGLLK